MCPLDIRRPPVVLHAGRSAPPTTAYITLACLVLLPFDANRQDVDATLQAGIERR